MNALKCWYCVVQWLAPSVATCTLVAEPETWEGTWVMDITDKGVLYALPDDAAMVNMDIIDIAYAGWEGVRLYLQSMN